MIYSLVVVVVLEICLWFCCRVLLNWSVAIIGWTTSHDVYAHAWPASYVAADKPAGAMTQTLCTDFSAQ